jgi:hypothetical protein
MHNKIMKSLPLALAVVLLTGPATLLQATEDPHCRRHS